MDGQDFFFFDNRWEGLCFLEAVVYWTFCDIYLALCVCAATIAAVWLEASQSIVWSLSTTNSYLTVVPCDFDWNG